MIAVREFTSENAQEEMAAHYKALRGRFFPMGSLVSIPKAPPLPDPEPVKGDVRAPTLEELLLSFRETYAYSATDERGMARKVNAKREARRLVNLVAAQHGMTPEDIFSVSHQRKHTDARRAAIAAVAERFPEWSLPQLGRFFGRDHSTILHNLRKAGVKRGGSQ
jgi:hypothetical protein